MLTGAIAQAAQAPLRIIAIDVEGGAATLYVTPEGKSLLVDTGWPSAYPKVGHSSERIVVAAKSMGLKHIDYVLVTHYHIDHVGGVAELIGKFPLGTFLDHGPNRETPSADADPAVAWMQTNAQYPAYVHLVAGHARRILRPGDRLRIGSLQLTTVTSDGAVLAQPLRGAGAANSDCASMQEKSIDGGEENARSVGVLLAFGNARIVTLGDLTRNVEKALVCPTNKVGHADLFFVSNHGTNLNNSPALLHALAPRVAVMGNGAEKGGDPESYDTIVGSPSVRRLWQLHFAQGGGAAHNPPPAYIANLSAVNELNATLDIAVFTDATITVTNSRTGFSESYAPDALRAPSAR